MTDEVLGEELQQARGEERSEQSTPQAVDATHDHDGDQEDCRLTIEGIDGHALRNRSCVQTTGDTGHERSKRERPQLVASHVDAGGQRRGLALANRCPRPSWLARQHVRRQHEHHERGDDDEPVVAGIGDGPRRPARRPDVAERLDDTFESRAAVRELRCPENDLDSGSKHQRDQGKIQPTDPQGRQADEHADDRSDDPADDEQHGIWQGCGESQAHGDPTSDAIRSNLTERNQADPAIQQPGAGRDDREHSHLREVGDPERSRGARGCRSRAKTNTTATAIGSNS